MKTDTIQAWQVDEGDVITLGSEATFTVYSMEDNGGSIDVVLTDEDGETDRDNPLSFTPDEDITLVVSLDDE